MSMTALERAIQVAGSQSRFAEMIGTSQQLVSYWMRNGKTLPAEFVLKAEAETAVSRHDLRPDIYPRESEAA
jgi:DNA-binding transcriptional regulator YdaS (Cro superfamily)